MNRKATLQQYSISIALTTKDREWIRCNALNNYARDMADMDEELERALKTPGSIVSIRSHGGEILRFRSDLIAYYSVVPWVEDEE